jgi:hypothetical protein
LYGVGVENKKKRGAKRENDEIDFDREKNECTFVPNSHKFKDGVRISSDTPKQKSKV